MEEQLFVWDPEKAICTKRGCRESRYNGKWGHVPFSFHFNILDIK